jgi:hypothetical protein
MKKEPVLRVATVTIANGATNSGAIDISKGTVVGIEFPAAMTGTGVTLQSAPTETGTYVTAYQGAADLAVVKQNSRLVLNASHKLWEGLGPWLRLASSGAEGAERTFKVYISPRA